MIEMMKGINGITGWDNSSLEKKTRKTKVQHMTGVV